MKSITLANHPTLKGVKFGRRQPVAPGPHLRLSRYRWAVSVPTPPAAFDYMPKGGASIAQPYLNDQLGICVVAGYYHVVGAETGNACGVPFVPTKDQLIKDYSAIGGYVPGNPATDNGCDEVTALNYWTQRGGANGTRILGWIAIDPTNRSEIEQAIYLFENVYFGVCLPDAWISPFPHGSGYVWDVAGTADPENGHCYVGLGYNAQGVKIDSWGMVGINTWAAIAKYAAAATGGALYSILTPDQLGRCIAKAPNGLDWSQLIADFDALGGHVPIPAPVPSPAPPGPAPAPRPGVTLAQAQAWATQGLAANWPK